ncbi:uncharacterized protein BP5553_01925 [Venustampulla echinocandica]|uniref:Mid2 domain-containing protein n=1 Tax=Venustampulla echinocandica TaxID=2656787 RepID=A0A370U2E1_9HELO|nr:uncharacterized protein BP5553_01925 [Venustampulla echinocandica]RDL41946.1 hypothetical protein BP5553_01925 [Venustampulla echinocandica]
MRLAQTPTSLLSLLLVALSNIESTQAWPIGELDFSFLTGRAACVSFCGADSQFCCTQGQSCTTLSGNIATCVAGGSNAVATGAGGVAVYTTTWTETGLVAHTSTVSSYLQAPTQSPPLEGAPICKTNLGETSCGTVCCPSDQTCGETAGTCVRRTTWAYNAPSGYSAPLRPTSGGVVTATASISPTTTQSFLPPATASGSTVPVISAEHNNKGLSPGAIAGIVIGTIAGVIILLLICFCCILRAGFDGLLAIFGLGKKKRRDERVEVIEERYSRHSGRTGSQRQTHTGWFGGAGRPSKVTDSRKKKSSGLGGFGAVGAGLLGLAVILGLKKKHEKEKPPRSDIGSSYYSYDSYTGSSPTQALTEERETHGAHTRDDSPEFVHSV